MKTLCTPRLCVSISLILGLVSVAAGQVPWRDALKQNAEWYGTPEAIRIADNLLLYQLDTGAWSKNVDMSTPLNEAEKPKLLADKRDSESTIDNGATFTQLAFLARVHTAKPTDKYRDAFFKGFDYLIKAQYANGGWPQFYPDLKGYYKHITYNDDAMIGVMKLLRDVAGKKPEYKFVDEARRAKAATAVQKGIECILKTQIVVEGKRTVWCAQHDEVTLAPAAARTFELISFSGGESVGIVRFLMSLDKPTPEIVASIKGAIEWFEKSKLTGIKVVQQDGDRVVVKDPNAGPLWARFYDIRTNQPIFVGRNGIAKSTVAEIESERRNGYAWYVESPATLLSSDYPKWLKKNKLN